MTWRQRLEEVVCVVNFTVFLFLSSPIVFLCHVSNETLSVNKCVL